MVHLTKYNRIAILALLGVLAGCTLPTHRNGPTSTVTEVDPNRTPSTTITKFQHSSRTNATTVQVSYQTSSDPAPDPPQVMDRRAPLTEGTAGSIEPAPAPTQSTEETLEPSAAFPQPTHSSDDPSDPFRNQAELSGEQLVAEVQARNPSLQAASAAWWAAAGRWPQAISLDDPMFATMISPSGVGTDDGGGWSVQASQKVPWSGKRALRGSVASAEADAMRGDIGDTRLRLAEMARTAFYNYYLAGRQLEVNTMTQRLLKPV